jgi:mRNA interferase YafQ
MKIIKTTSYFKRDVKRIEKRGKKFDAFKNVIEKIARGEHLDPKYRDHQLSGQYKGSREYHIEPDWLLVCEVSPSELILIRTGTHSDLFG